MRNLTVKGMVSVMLTLVLLISQIVPVAGSGTDVRFDNGAYFASKGIINCYPDKGKWSTNETNSFYIEPHPKTGDEIKPTNINNSFKYFWTMPLKGTSAQTGLKYRIKLQVYGQALDSDVAGIFLDFWAPLGDGRSGSITVEWTFNDFSGWNDVSFSGYVPEGATSMQLTLTGEKGTTIFDDNKCEIYFRNIEVYITDDVAPIPKYVEFGERRELGTPEERQMKDYYGIGDDVYWDLEFSEPIFVNDPDYLAYVRGLSATERASFLSNQLTPKYPDEKLLLDHVLHNIGRGMSDQFGELKIKFKYRNADGRDMEGYAYPVDKSRYNKETYGNDYSKQIKFKYSVRPGDEFRASDIYEMVLEGGVITDNAFNPMPNEYRTISFASDAASGVSKIYRTFTRDFRVETTAPVLLEINGGLPEGTLDRFQTLPLYFKFSEPVYITVSDEALIRHNINKLQFENYQRAGMFSSYDAKLFLNALNRDWKGDLDPYRSGTPDAYYAGGNGTTMLEFRFDNLENSFDPLEITGSIFSDWKDKESGSTERVSYGEVYVMDAAGNKAPLLPKGGVKLSDSKRYVGDTEPPVITVHTKEAEKEKGGFYLKINVTDEVSGVDYDTLEFSIGYTNADFGGIMRAAKPLVPGRWYHSHELAGMFGIDPGSTNNYRLFVHAKDKKGNMFYGSTHGFRGYGWSTDINVTRTDIDISSIIEQEEISVSLETNLGGAAEGRVYLCSADWVREDGVNWRCKGLWYCMTREAAMPEFSENSGIWRYKESHRINTSEDFEGDPRERDGYYYLHIIAADGDKKPIGSKTVPQPLLFDFKPPQVNANAETQADGSIKVMIHVSDNYTPRKDIAVKYILGNSNWQQLPENGEIIISKDELKPGTYVTVMATDAYQNYTAPNFGPYGNAESKPSASAPYVNFYKGNKYTNEDFAELHIFNPVEEFSWSMDGESWSGWIPLEKGATSFGTEGYSPCIPLPDKEGSITFYTKYRDSAGKESDTAASTVVRDVTPPTARVKYSSYYDSNVFYTAELVDISDNLCPSEDIKVIGYVPGYYNEIITAGEPHYFILEDAAGNKGVVEAYKEPVPVIVKPPVIYQDHDDDDDDDYEPEPELTDTEAPEIDVIPNGSASDAPIVSPQIIVSDNGSIAIIEYAFSMNEDIESVTSWSSAVNGSYVNLTCEDAADEGLWYLHVYAMDAAGNTAYFTSDPFHMVMADEESDIDIVYSGEHEGVMRAFIVSQEPITVSEAVFDLSMDDEVHTFVYTYDSDGTEGSITAVRKYGSGVDECGTKGTVTMDPYDSVTSEPVKVTIEAGWDEDEDEYNTTIELRPEMFDFDPDFDPDSDPDFNPDSVPGILGLMKNEEMISEGKIKIMIGRIIQDFNPEPIRVFDAVYGEGYLDDELLSELEENDDYYLRVYKAEITFDENGYIMYLAGGEMHTVRVGHIVEEDWVDNVTVTMTEGGRWAYVPGSLLASAGKYSGMLKAPDSLYEEDISPPSGRVSYTWADPKKGPVTAKLKLSDDSGGKVTITNNGGSSSYVFKTNGQFVFEFEDEAGNKGRALAQLTTIPAEGPRVAVSYSSVHPTREAVKVTITPEPGSVLKSGDIQTVQENGSYIFSTEVNGSWNFTFANEYGIEKVVKPSVENIDRIPPKLWLDYVYDSYKNTITAIVRSDELIIPAEGSTISQVYPCTDKERYTMRALDELGNEAVVTASAAYLDEPGAGDVKINFSTAELTKNPVTITLTSDKEFAVLNNGGKKELTVPENGQYSFVIRDSLGKIKVLTAEVKNIVLDAPVITLGYPDYIEINRRGSIDLMKFTAVDSIDGDVKNKVKITGTVNTLKPGIYTVTYSVVNSLGSEAVKTLTVKVRSDEEQIVWINGVKYEGEPIPLAASKLQVTAEGFSGQVSLKLAEGFVNASYFKNGGTAGSLDNIPVSKKGWLTLYVYDNERNNRLINVLITDLGGEQ
ncbi:MAG TPA: DUF5011 domain-containing protein [Bacillota bacterium]|nr:DUF5011 domain-containing protein [Bacillota bacterium]